MKLDLLGLVGLGHGSIISDLRVRVNTLFIFFIFLLLFLGLI